MNEVNYNDWLVLRRLAGNLTQIGTLTNVFYVGFNTARENGLYYNTATREEILNLKRKIYPMHPIVYKSDINDCYYIELPYIPLNYLKGSNVKCDYVDGKRQGYDYLFKCKDLKDFHIINDIIDKIDKEAFSRYSDVYPHNPLHCPPGDKVFIVDDNYKIGEQIAIIDYEEIEREKKKFEKTFLKISWVLVFVIIMIYLFFGLCKK